MGNLPRDHVALTDLLLLQREGVARITSGGFARLEDREALQDGPAQDQCGARAPEERLRPNAVTARPRAVAGLAALA